MISKEFLDSLEGVVFPRKLWHLATSDEVRSIRWAKHGSTFEIDSVLLIKECFHPSIFNVKSNQHVLRQLSYYKFEKLDHKQKIWEFRHPNFQAGKEHLLHLIKRTPQRVPKKYVKDVERRCSSRIRSISSKKTPGMYKIDTEEEMDTVTEYVEETNPNRKKIKFEENILNGYDSNSNYCSHGDPAGFGASLTSFSFSKSNAAEENTRNSSGLPKLEKKKPNTTNSVIKRKRGRPRKSTVENKKPSLTKMKGIQNDRGTVPLVTKHFKQVEILPKQGTFACYDNTYWIHEKHDFRNTAPMKQSENLSKYIPRIAFKQMPSEMPDRMTNAKYIHKSGVSDICITNDSCYHDMDADGRAAQVVADWFNSQERTCRINLLSTTVEDEGFTTAFKVSKTDKVSENDELYFKIKRKDWFNENESCKNWHGDITNEEGTANQISNVEMHSYSDNHNDLLIAKDIPIFQDVNSDLGGYSFSDTKPPIHFHMVSNPNRDLQPYQEEEQAASSNGSFYDKNVILSEVSMIQKYDSDNIHGKNYYESNSNQKGYSHVQQTSSSNLIMGNVSKSDDVSDSNTSGDDRINLVRLLDFDDNCERRNNKKSHLLELNPNRKSSQSKMIPLSTDSQQWFNKTSQSCPGQFSVCSIKNDHNYHTSGNDYAYSLGEIMSMGSDISQTISLTSHSIENCNPDVNHEKQSVQEQKLTGNESKLVNLKSNANETQYVANDVLEMGQPGQNSNTTSSEYFLESTVETLEDSYEIEQQNSKTPSIGCFSSFVDSSTDIFEKRRMESPGQDCVICQPKCFPNFDFSAQKESDKMEKPLQNCNIPLNSIKKERDEMERPLQNYISSLDSRKPVVTPPAQKFEGKDKIELPGQNCTIPSSVESNAQMVKESTQPGSFGKIDEEIDKFIDVLKSAEDSDDVIFLGQITPTHQELRELIASFDIPNSNTDKSQYNCKYSEEHAKTVPFNFFASEVKPMTLLDFLNDQLQNGKMYSWNAQKPDIIIRNCTVDFNNWMTLKSGSKSNVHL